MNTFYVPHTLSGKDEDGGLCSQEVCDLVKEQCRDGMQWLAGGGGCWVSTDGEPQSCWAAQGAPLQKPLCFATTHGP